MDTLWPATIRGLRLFKRSEEFSSDLTSKREKLRRENEELRTLSRNTKFDGSDEKALIIAALTTILPVVVIGALLFYLVVAFFFRV